MGNQEKPLPSGRGAITDEQDIKAAAALIEAELRARYANNPMNVAAATAALVNMCRPSEFAKPISVRPDPDNPGAIIVEYEYVDPIIKIEGVVPGPWAPSAEGDERKG